MRRPFLFIALSLLALLGIAADARDRPFRERIRERLQGRLVTAVVPDAARPGPGGAITAPGLYRYTVRHGGIERAWLVHVPRGFDAGRPMPVLYAFHGGGGHMGWQANDAVYGLLSKSEQAGFVAVFPNGVGALPGGRMATWNAGHCCGDARDRGADDVGFVRRIHADLSRRLHVDPARVYATGMSNGGMMAYRLACEAPDVFRAIAAVAGTDNTGSCRPARPVAVLHIHARDDTHVLFEGGAGPDAFRDRAKITEFASVATTVEGWVRRNACPRTPRRVLDVPGATCRLHAPCADGSAVQVCVTEAGGHSWPGGGAVRGKAPSNALSANDTMWAFFQSLPPRAVR